MGLSLDSGEKTQSSRSNSSRSHNNDDDIMTERKKSKNKHGVQEQMNFDNRQLELDEQAMIDQMNASNMVAAAIIDKEKDIARMQVEIDKLNDQLKEQQHNALDMSH